MDVQSQYPAVYPDSGWNAQALSPADSAQPSPIYAVVNRPDLDYPSPAPTASPPYPQSAQQGQFGTAQQTTDPLLAPFPQIESSIGPSRVLTRRQRAALEQNALLSRRASLPSAFQRQSHQAQPSHARHNSALYMSEQTAPASRPQTPNKDDSDQFQSQHGRLSLTIANSLPLQIQSPSTYHPITPTSLSSPFSSYPMYDLRSASDSRPGNQRPPSPALSNASALTSVSSSASGPNTQTFAPYTRSSAAAGTGPQKMKQRKQRLFNVDRKSICLYQQQYPNARQEDIAVRYGVERSTISKILKNKQKWLNVPEHENGRVAKHRPSKFPDVESQLMKWLEECYNNKTPLTDSLIRSKAKETARRLHIPDEKFKASSGWVENFKQRQGIKGGVWVDAAKYLIPPQPISTSPYIPPKSMTFQDRSGTEMEIESPGSPESEEDDQNLQQQQQPSVQQAIVTADSSSLPSSWPSAASSSHTHVHDPPLLPVQQALSQEHEDPPHVSPVPTTHQDHSGNASEATQQHYDSSAAAAVAAAAAVYYQPQPQPVISSGPRQATLADAEEAVNTLILFIDTTGRGILEPDERQMLNTIKCALFQAGSGVPFDRSRQ